MSDLTYRRRSSAVQAARRLRAGFLAVLRLARPARLIVGVLVIGTLMACGSADEQGAPQKSVTADPGESELLPGEGESELIPGDEADDETRQGEWEGRTGEDWDAFVGGYEEGFSTGCSQLFDFSPDGSLYDDGAEYTDADCPGPGDPETDGADIPSEVPDDPDSEGHDLGVTAGCSAIFDEQGIEELFYGKEAVTADDCAGGELPARERGGSQEPPQEPPQRRESCDGATYEDYGGDYGGNTWGGYSPDKRRAVACLFIENNPADCGGVDPAELAQGVYDGYGGDFPLAEPVRDALLTTCKRLR